MMIRLCAACRNMGGIVSFNYGRAPGCTPPDARPSSVLYQHPLRKLQGSECESR